MSSLASIIDWFLENWEFECGENNQDVFEEMQADWERDTFRFPLADVLKEDLPEFLEWIQERIDEECEDTTETITFTPERTEADEAREEEIIETEIELLRTRKELLELEIAELEPVRGGIFERVGRFIRNIFGG